jgi:hypothetical protein
MFGGYSGTSGDSTFLNFKSDDTFQFNVGGSNGTMVSNAVFRDPSAWYIFDLAFDSTQATASNRAKFWVNGVLQTWAGGTVTLNSVTEFALANANNRVGSNWDSTLTFDGYLTEINFIDGQALTPSSFGSTNAITGVWQPAKYTGTYGTNGFYLNFSDNSNNTATTIGKDYSGNGNNWTPNNISVTAGATYDSMTDVPTLTSATAANYCVMSPIDMNSSSITVSDGNLNVAGLGAASVRELRGTMGVNSGKWYYESTAQSSGSFTIGITKSSNSTSLDWAVGVGAGNTYVYYGGNGNKFNGASGSAYGASFTSGDVIGVAFDLTSGSITFYKNNSSQGVAFTWTPDGSYWSPSVEGDSASVTAGAIFNFGQRPFTYTPPTGYVALNTYNLPDSTIKNGAGYMAATLYTGNGSTQTVNNSAGFYPDFNWIKARSNVGSNVLVNSVVGGTKQLFSNLTDAEQTNTNITNGISSSGIALGNNSSGTGSTNQSAYTYVLWQWLAGAGTSSSNTNGSITSTVSVGATQGFSVVTYTGTGANATVGHGLGVAPSMIIIKSRITAYNWAVWHTSLGGGDNALQLNTTIAVTSAFDYWNGANTSSVFTLGTDFGVNKSAETYVAYCFAAVKGYSAFGSYTGNGSADGPFVYLGFRPRFLMIKRTDTTSDW